MPLKFLLSEPEVRKNKSLCDECGLYPAYWLWHMREEDEDEDHFVHWFGRIYTTKLCHECFRKRRASEENHERHD